MPRLALIPSLSLLALMGLAPIGAEEQPAEAPAETTTEEAAPQANQRPYLGIMPSRNNSDGSGIPVARVFPNSTASSLGLQNGDRILAINGSAVNSTQELSTLLQTLPVGEHITLQWQRGEEIMEEEGELKALPSRFNQARELRERQQAIRQLQQERENLQGPQELAASMAQLATILQELPGQLDETAKKFKEVYPDGTFTVELNIDIRTNADDPNPLNIELGNDGEGDGDDQAEVDQEDEVNPNEDDQEP